MPTSIRIDQETEALLERAAQVRAQSKSQVIRTALKLFCGRMALGNLQTPYDSIKEFLGCAEGPPDLARRSRHYLQDALRGRRRPSH